MAFLRELGSGSAVCCRSEKGGVLDDNMIFRKPQYRFERPESVVSDRGRRGRNNSVEFVANDYNTEYCVPVPCLT